MYSNIPIACYLLRVRAGAEATFINLYSSPISHRVGILEFSDESHPDTIKKSDDPEDLGRDIPVIHYPMFMFSAVKDILRNEQPIILSYDLDDPSQPCGIKTIPEPVGEGPQDVSGVHFIRSRLFSFADWASTSI